MLVVNDGTVRILGTKAELMAELSILMTGLVKKDIMDKEDLEMSLELALMDSEELARRRRECIAMMSMLVGDIDEEDNEEDE